MFTAATVCMSFLSSTRAVNRKARELIAKCDAHLEGKFHSS